MKKCMLVLSKIPEINFDQRAFLKKIFQQSFSANTQVENCFKIIRSIIYPSNFQVIYLKFNRGLEEDPKFFKNYENLNSEYLRKNYPISHEKKYVAGISNLSE